MRNSWCKVVDGEIVDGPRAWHDNTPPDATWIPHVLVDPPHTINDNWDGMKFEVVGDQVVETNLYSPKSPEQIAAEIQGIKSQAAQEVAYAAGKLTDPNLNNRAEWEAFKAAWEQMLTVTELSWEHHMPPRPVELPMPRPPFGG